MSDAKKKLKSLNIKDLCLQASEAVDDAEIILGGMEWLINDPEASKIISSFNPEVKESIEIIKSSSKTPLRIGKELITSVDKFLESPRCKHKTRTRKDKDGIIIMRNLFENVTNYEAYDNICLITDSFKSYLESLLSILKSILSSFLMKNAITYATGPSTISKMSLGVEKGEKALVFTNHIHKMICINLRKSISKK